MIERRARVADIGYQVQVTVCAVRGCGALAFDDACCPRCREEIDALTEMAAHRDERREALHARFGQVCRTVRRRLWVAELLIVGVGLSYLGCTFGALFFQWLEAQ